MDSEKGNRVLLGGHNVPPPWFLEPTKSLVWTVRGLSVCMHAVSSNPIFQLLPRTS